MCISTAIAWAWFKDMWLYFVYQKIMPGEKSSSLFFLEGLVYNWAKAIFIQEALKSSFASSPIRIRVGVGFKQVVWAPKTGIEMVISLSIGD